MRLGAIAGRFTPGAGKPCLGGANSALQHELIFHANLFAIKTKKRKK
jgi:hypothetical protein